MTGGYITENRSMYSTYSGCGVVIDSTSGLNDTMNIATSRFTMSGGEISNNIIYDFGWTEVGAGVFCGGDMELSGDAKITGNKILNYYQNTHEGSGGGVYCTGTANFKMSGGEISENDAGQGGGIYVYQEENDSNGLRGMIEICGGRIVGNKAVSEGGGIYFEQKVGSSGTSKDTFTMSGGEITGNTAVRGGGIFTTSQFSRTAGMLCNNTATQLGDDITVSCPYYPVNKGFDLSRLGPIPEGDWKLADDCQHTIDGWYIDGCKSEYFLDPADPRWNASTTIGNDVSACIPDQEIYAQPYTGTRWQYASAIKAAHGNKVVNTYILTYDKADPTDEYQMSEEKKELAKNSKVLLQLDGGTLSSQPAGTYNSAANTWDIVMTENVTAGTPTKAGYYFTGWMVEDHSGTEYDYILKARWTREKTMQVLFDFNGGMDPQDKSSFDVISFQLPFSSQSLDKIDSIRSQKDALKDIIQKDGYLCEDWERVTTGTVPYPEYEDKTIYSDDNVSIDTPNDQLVVYRAKWREIAKYSVLFDSNGGTPVEKHIEFDESDFKNERAFITELQNFERPNSTRTGYILDYWYFDLLEYLISNGQLEDNSSEVVYIRAARAKAEQQYAAGEITEDTYWITLEQCGFYNMDALVKLLDEVYQEEIEDLFGPGAKLGYGLGCYFAFEGIFEAIPSITLKAKWTPVITVRPANIISYVGGSSYSSAVDEEGNTVSGNGLPEPGFVFSFPEELKNIDVEKLYLQYEETDAATLQWKFVKYGEGEHNIYRIVPAGGNSDRDIRIEFINADGERITSDSFDSKRYLNQSLTIEIYSEGIDAGKVSFVYEGAEYKIATGTATLMVEGTTSDVAYAGVASDAESINAGKPGLVANAGTTFTINNSDVQVEDTSGISLLFDEIINSNAANNDRTNLIQQRTDDVLGQTSNNRHYDFKYLDLVDRDNGNAWIKADQNITAYWPLPKGTNSNTSFTLLHFADAHRNMSNADIQTAIQTGRVETVKIRQVTDTHVVFEVGPEGFSPFALVWETKNGGNVDPNPTEHTLRYETNSNEMIQPETKKDSWIKDYKALPIPERDGYTFAGWYLDKDLTMPIVGNVEVQGIVTIYAKWDKNSSGGGSSVRYTLCYDSNGGTEYRDEEYRRNTVVKLDKTPERKGYTFTGWYADRKLTDKISSIQMTSDKTVYAGWRHDYTPADLNSKDHVSYVSGYPDGTVRPDAPITRAETATMIYRLLTDARRAEIDTEVNSFGDVSSSDWFVRSVSTMANGGYIVGYPDGTFGGSKQITRAEFVTMLVRFIGLKDAECSFHDVSQNHWAYRFIAMATDAGWIAGYTDGTFAPDQTITRAEAMTILNSVLNRGVNEKSELLNFKVWPDNPQTAWYYYEVIEASNGHEYTGARPSEDWTKLVKDLL